MADSGSGAPADGVRRTPLYDTHAELGARFVPFAGWDMPVRYGSILDEARAVRAGAGLFDVSHMGRLEIDGADAANLLNAVLSVDARRLGVGRGRYNLICDDEGGIIDDCIAYRRGKTRFLVVPNASNTDAVLDRLISAKERGGGAGLERGRPKRHRRNRHDRLPRSARPRRAAAARGQSLVGDSPVSRPGGAGERR